MLKFKMADLFQSFLNILRSATRLKVATVILFCVIIALTIVYISGCDPGWNLILCSINIIKKTTEKESMLKAVNLDEVGSVQTKFSHLSEAEFDRRLMPAVDLDCYKSSRHNILGHIPDRFDWRNSHIVGPVLDQKLCNGCWAFSIVGAVETMDAKQNPPNSTHHNIISLSIQEVIDCSSVNKGCRGGNVGTALSYIRDKQIKIVTEKEYPLKLIDEDCKLDKNTKGVGIKNYTSECFPSSDLICSVIANHGPVITLVNAKPWMNYVGGIINGGCTARQEYLRHVVQIVGYNRNHPVPYYIVKNSWGDDFGQGGYVYVSMGRNMCGIESNIFYLDVN